MRTFRGGDTHAGTHEVRRSTRLGLVSGGAAGPTRRIVVRGRQIQLGGGWAAVLPAAAVGPVVALEESPWLVG